MSLSSAGSTASVSSTVDCPADPHTELHLLGQSAGQAAPIWSTEPAAPILCTEPDVPAVPDVPAFLPCNACRSSSLTADGQSMLRQLVAIGSRAELLPLTFPGIRGSQSSGRIVDIVDYDARTALDTVTTVI